MNKQLTLMRLSISVLSLFFVVSVGFGQKPKIKPKPTPKTAPKSTPKTTPKDDNTNDPFGAEIKKTLEEITSSTFAANQQKAIEFYKQGQAFWKELEIDKTIENYTKALNILPNYADALRERGLVYFLTGRTDLALMDFDKVLKTDPNNAKVLHYRGLAYSAKIELYSERGFSSLAFGSASQALADFDKAIKLEPNESIYYTNRGKVLLDSGRYREAVADLEKSIGLSAKDERAYIYLGLAKANLESGAGMEEFDKALQINPKSAEAYFYRGNIHRGDFLLIEAIADYTKAIQFDPENGNYYNARGMAYYLQQDGMAAAKDFTKAIQKKKEYGMAHYNRALTYKKFPYSVSDDENEDPWKKMAMQHQKIKEDFDAAIKFSPNFAESYIERGIIYFNQVGSGELDKESAADLALALADFNNALSIDSKAARAYNGRASCYEKYNKADLALKDYSRAIELDPKLVTAYMGRMGVYCKLGKKELSIADEMKVKELGYAALNVCSIVK